MRISRIDIKRDDSILRIENWPSVTNTTTFASQSDLAGQSSINLAVLSTGMHSVPVYQDAVCQDGVCQDGVCQLGEWKPNRDAA